MYVVRRASLLKLYSNMLRCIKRQQTEHGTLKQTTSIKLLEVNGSRYGILKLDIKPKGCLPISPQSSDPRNIFI